MRQRRVKNLDEKLEALSRFTVEDPEEHRGSWREMFAGREKLFLEIGCGKGRFINSLAEMNGDGGFLAVEGHGSSLLRALQLRERRELSGSDVPDNLFFIYKYIKDIRDIFVPGELDGIYLNFSDPWPKAKHEKRRLTYRKFLEGYTAVLKPGGFVQLKTDQENLYEFTLDEMKAVDLEAAEKSRDLYNSSYIRGNVPTEYEEKFAAAGQNIFYIRAFT